jgi:hypothetical protein
MPYGYVDDPETRKRLEKELEERYAEIAESSLACVSCTNSRRKAKANDDPKWRTAMCKNHRMMQRIAYATSPLSETYWTS